MANEKCIWCNTDDADSLEHIAPDSLGCPPNFVLREGVCQRCNNSNSRLDRALLVPFEPLTVLKGIPRKRGRLPTIDGYSSIASRNDNSGPIISINRESYDIFDGNGRKIKGFRKGDPVINFQKIDLSNGKSRISFDIELRFSDQAVRGIYKIAIESIAFFEGLTAVRHAELNDVRDFVSNGCGDFKVIMLPDPNRNYDSFFQERFRSENGGQVVGMTLLGIAFICDLSPGFLAGEKILSRMKNEGLPAQVIPNWPKALWRKNNPNCMQ